MNELRYPAAFSPYDIILFNTIKHKDTQIVITALDSISSLSYVGTYDGKLLLYEYRIIDVNNQYFLIPLYSTNFIGIISM